MNDTLDAVRRVLESAGLVPARTVATGDKFGMRVSGFDAILVGRNVHVKHSIAKVKRDARITQDMENYAQALRNAGYGVQWKINPRHRMPYLVVEVRE